MPYVFPFVVGLFLAFLLEPVVDFMAKGLKLPRNAASLITVLAVVAMLVIALVVGTTRVAAEVSALYWQLPTYYEEISARMAEIARIAGEVSERLPDPLQSFFQTLWQRLNLMLGALATGAGGVVKGIPSLLITMVFSFLSTYFILRDKAALSRFLEMLIPSALRGSALPLGDNIVAGVAGFIRAQVLLVLITMLVNIAGLAMVGCRYSAALGVLLAVLDILPLVGPGLVYTPWIGYHLVWGNPKVGLGLIVLYATVSSFRQIAGTHLVGREMGLHPLAGLVSIYAGYKLFGALGIVYGPLVAVLIKGLWSSGLIPHEGGASN